MPKNAEKYQQKKYVTIYANNKKCNLILVYFKKMPKSIRIDIIGHIAT